MPDEDLGRFSDLTFDDFRRLARDKSLSPIEKVGFPNSYRDGKEKLIFEDIVRKADNLLLPGRTVLEIGPGCSQPALMMIDLCRRQGHQLVFVDSIEMLSQVPESAHLRKAPGRFPIDCASLLDEFKRRIDVIVAYSVLHYVFVEASVFEFVDRANELLAEGGQFLIGDIPNISKRKRFFSSTRGIRFHQEFTSTAEKPEIRFNTADPGKLDDSVILSLLARSRAAGLDAYLLSQPADLPMANRREDILIVRP